MNSLHRMVGALAAMVFLSGCAVAASGEPEETGATAEPLSADNALHVNALHANALYPNALEPNALHANALHANALTPAALAAIQDPGDAGTLSRELLRYTVNCALNSSQTFNFSWTDSQSIVHNESYPGSAGIEPAWATQPLSAAGQRLVSACLIARVNYYAVQVIISMRSVNDPFHTLVNSSELKAYTHIEGAFWGNLFTSKPYAYSCYNAANVSLSRSDKRECATGHLNSTGTLSECGIIHIQGDCTRYCPTINGAGQYYQSCIDQPGVSTTSTNYVITTALP